MPFVTNAFGRNQPSLVVKLVYLADSNSGRKLPRRDVRAPTYI